MSRIRPVEGAEITDEIAALLDHARREGAPDARVVSIYAHSPVGVAFFQFWNKVMGPSSLPIRIKELVRIYNSAGAECAYCTIVRSESAKAEGVTEDLLAEMMDYRFSDAFDERERAALDFAETYRTAPEDLKQDALWARLRERFSDAEIIELAILCMLTTGGGAFVKALDLASWTEVCELSPKIAEVAARKRAREQAE